MDTVSEVLGEVDVEGIQRVLGDHAVLTVAIVVGLLIVYVFARRGVQFAVRRTLQASAGEYEQGGVTAIELDKRSRTLESLLTTLARAAVAASLVFLFIGFFGLWGLLAGLALLLAALTIAGQSIVLDYMMGILIIIEGTYFEGDDISAGDPA